MDKNYKKDWNIRFNNEDELPDWLQKACMEIDKKYMELAEERIAGFERYTKWLEEKLGEKSESIRILQAKVSELENDKRIYEDYVRLLKSDASFIEKYPFPIGEA